MDLSKISIEARTRSAWEALDLGFVLARAWWKPLFLSWFLPALCVFLPLLLLWGNSEWLPWLIVWWLKPLFDRGPLYIASRRLFGDDLALSELFRELPRLYRTEAFQWLTIRRFSVTRSFDMPLTLLEKVKGKQRASRQQVLHRSYAGAASWLTVVCVHVEAILFFATFVFIALLIPEQIQIDYWGLFIGEDTLFIYAAHVCTFIIMSIVGPFYALSGFAMYISRRIDLEAWDIEIRFRHLVEKQKSKNTLLGASASALLLGVLSFAIITPQAVWAQSDLFEPEIQSVFDDANPPSQPVAEFIHEPAIGEQAKTKITTILDGEQFHQIESVSGWRLKNTQSEESEVPGWLVSLIEFFENHAEFFGALGKILAFPFKYIEYLLILLALVIVVLIIYKFRKPIQNFIKQTQQESLQHEPPKVMFGLDVTRESLPEDVPSEALNLWQQGKYRESISLLYRALLTELIHQHGFTFADSDTEGECVATVKVRGDLALSRYTMTLTGFWQNLAYGHILPETSDVVHLCDGWREVFTHE
ncbi:hypothetical protein P886_3952 [Alteromonadaceae bacterium 2753L.S.0a.02]|nr:hypothetical protein P886_3952 [Alteromonadaceae bacterium 2753L.S.0a.02]